MGGIGKTTLARKTYDDLEIRHRFDIHVWVTVSQEYQSRDLLLGVVSFISQLTNKIKTATNDELMDMIYKKLMGRRYLIVMDDIWSSEIWDLMTRIFPDDSNGSRIILTSRLKDVAMHADPDNSPHEMRLLNADDSWKLLHDKVFGVQQQVCPPELEDIGKQITQKCQGLPLALLLVAGHLSKIARTPEIWEDVAKSVSEVVANESGDSCLGVLAMSYNYLPRHLKPCFLYMGVFPEDSEVNIQRLINLWVSEGFLRKEGDKTLEEVGRNCCEDLVSRNLLMVRSRRFNGEMRTCGVHDLVRDLILREAEKEKFVQVIRIHEVTNPSAETHCVRRNSFHSGLYQADWWESFISDHTRTLHFFHGLGTPSKQIPLLVSFKLLRVLAILDFTFLDFPFEITKLIHLRYLQLDCHGDLDSSVSELYNLETFIFCQLGDKSSFVPETIWHMKPLRHLHVSHYFSSPTPSDTLQNLEELSCVCLSSCTPELFFATPNLKMLKIQGSKKECEGNISQPINSISFLKKLEILKFTCVGLYLPRIPSMYALPTSLKRLTLSCTYLPWEDMANIVMLPNLQVLKIKHSGFYGDVWRLNDEHIFNQLKFLLMDWTNLKCWEAGSVNFPELQHLVLKNCYYLEEVPEDFGEICTLESIELYDCNVSAAESVKKIQDEQESMGNDCLSFLIMISS